MKPSLFQVDSPLRPEELRASLSERCREWRWPPSITAREAGIDPPRIAGGPDRFRMWTWPRPRGTIPVLDCRTTVRRGGCTVRVRMRRNREGQLSGIPIAALLGGVPWAAGWGSAGFVAFGLIAGAAVSLYAVFGSFQIRTEQRMQRLVEILRNAAKLDATLSALIQHEIEGPGGGLLITQERDLRRP